MWLVRVCQGISTPLVGLQVGQLNPCARYLQIGLA